MSFTALDVAARTVLQQYPVLLRPQALMPLGNNGGFSGALLWRVDCALGAVCLRAWPAGVTVEALAFQHDLIQRARRAGLLFVPSLHAACNGATWVELGGRLWQATSWQPGCPDAEAQPTRERVGSASVAVARLHDAWAALSPGKAVCPALVRRLTRAREWMALVHSGWQATLTARAVDPLPSLAKRAWQLLAVEVPSVPKCLASWSEQAVPLQPCLCDVWRENLLFEGDALTGLVDFGSVKIDHVSVDLARLLGSTAGGDAALWTAGLDAYRRLRAFSAADEDLARRLDRTGVVIGVVNWLLWIFRDGRQYDNWPGVARRLGTLIARMEGWRGDSY